MINRFSRDSSLKIHFMLDQLLPPILRDQRWLMAPLLRLVTGKKYSDYMDFKARAHLMTEEEFRALNAWLSDTLIKRDTDLNQASIAMIQKAAVGRKLLEVGCGGGFMAGLLSERFEVTAVDIVIDEALKQKYPGITFQAANAEALPFPDHSFDTVLCAHTLEHVRNMPAAIRELRRVARRLIIVVPRQRPYRYTFDLHVNFFPYLHSLQLVMGNVPGSQCLDADGDIFYMEDTL